MKTVILAGGLGTRLSEETTLKPKPMVEIGGRPMLWHLMGLYADHGYKDFVVACGYKGWMIKEYFHQVVVHISDFTVDLGTGAIDVRDRAAIDWKVSVVDTGPKTMTGGRLKRLKGWIGDATFMATYGDGLGSVDIQKLVAFHKSHGKLATVTAVRPPARFGGLVLEGNSVREFSEKPQTGEGWINGGFFVFEPQVLDYLTDDTTVLERDPMERLARDGQLQAFFHEGFWQPMDTLREKELLESLWATGAPPWRVKR